MIAAQPCGGATTRVDFSQRQVALTFDDGPDPTTTPMVLDVLERHRVRATFFCLGGSASSHPDLVRAIAARGHELASHGWDHRSAVLDRGAGGLLPQRRSIAQTRAALGPMVSRFHRPAYGHESRWTKLAALTLGCRVIGWSDSPRDWLEHPVDSLAELIVASLRPGGIVLLHDGLVDHDGAHVGRSVMVEALDRALSACGDQWEFTTVGALLRGGPAIRRRRRMIP
jgi:chitooligosaccharide deacetylase